jgi:acyl transferase domain-containing protein
MQDRDTANDIAIIGMSGRFPGARNIPALWENLVSGAESVVTLSAADLRGAGVPESLLDDPHYVPRKGVTEGVDLFDAAFFSYSPREAEAIDPQQRIMLECAWSALEDAGYDPHRCPPATGVFAGCNMNTYLLFNLAHSEAALDNVHALGIASEKDFLATRVSHKLNLRGPSLSVQCACSTSLVCVHLACQSLLSGESEMALAGGVSVTFPQAGYFYEEGGVFSPDGHCRAFDQNAAGTLSGDGVAVVVLKRYQDAVRDRDHIYARIVGSAINNDGSQKASFAAPTVNGQMQVISEALGVARLEPKDIGYVETHGTGTPFGDAIELAALSRVFTAGGVAPRACTIGALKPNIGHLDQAAGVANVVKAALSLHHQQIPPTINVRELNAELQAPTTPLQVARTLTPWPRTSTPRRAGVSSFGFGGTNAHVILEEAPLEEERPARQHWQILPFSARTDAALDASISQLQSHFAQHGELPLRDAAYVLQEGRGRFSRGGFIVARTSEEAAEILDKRDPKRLPRGVKPDSSSIYFLFPGQGAQFPDMGRDLYETRPVFRRYIDRAASSVRDLLGLDLRELLFPNSADREAAQARLSQTRFTQPCLFAIEYALARLWMDCGVMPQAMLGHSLGEYVAACLAGVFRFEDALRLVTLRGALIQELPPGDMIAVQAPAAKVRSLVENSVSIAAINAPDLCTVSGDPEAIGRAAAKLAEQGYAYQKLHTSHAFHSGMMDAILDRFEQAVAAVERSAPLIPFVSNVTGKTIVDEEAMDPAYWRRHLRGSVLFADGAATLLDAGRGTFIEVGPGQTLTNLLARQRQFVAATHVTVNSIGTARANISHEQAFLNAVGRVWLQGHAIEWKEVRNGADVRRVPLPTYPFERVRYLAEPHAATAGAAVKASSTERQPLDRWMYLPTWTRTPLGAPAPGIFKNRACLLLTDDAAFVRAVQNSAPDLDLVWARSGEQFAREADGAFVIRPDCGGDVQELMAQATASGRALTDVAVAWSMGRGETVLGASDAKTESVAAERLIKVLHAIAACNLPSNSLRLTVLTAGAQDVSGTESIVTADATLVGLCKVIPQEYQQLQCRNIDFAPAWNVELAAAQFAAELAANDARSAIAYRGRARFREVYTPLSQDGAIEPAALRQNGAVLITGGLGEVGLRFAEYFAERYSARLCLVGRSALPRPEAWEAWLREHPGNDRVSKVIARLQRMLRAGMEIELATADVSDRDAMKAAFDAARKRFGQIDCVVHAAGVSGADTFCGLGQTTAEVLARHFRAKVDGLRVLEELVHGEPGLDLVILQSSLFGVLGGGGCGAYAAATVFMDRVAARHGQEANAARWISIAWDGWAPEEENGQAMDPFAIRPAEVGPVLERALALKDVSYLAVSTADLESRLERWARPQGAATTAQEASASTKVYARPSLATEYQAPQSSIEELLVAMWEELLGIKPIGVHDDFFELGGHSLLATLILGRVADLFPVRIEFHDIVNHPSVSKLAALIESLLLQKIEQMSDEEAARMLAALPHA